jgi:hypothetical protein
MTATIAAAGQSFDRYGHMKTGTNQVVCGAQKALQRLVSGKASEGCTSKRNLAVFASLDRAGPGYISAASNKPKRRVVLVDGMSGALLKCLLLVPIVRAQKEG